MGGENMGSKDEDKERNEKEKRKDKGIEVKRFFDPLGLSKKKPVDVK